MTASLKKQSWPEGAASNAKLNGDALGSANGLNCCRTHGIDSPALAENQAITCQSCRYYELIRRKRSAYGLCHFIGCKNPIPCQFYEYGKWLPSEADCANLDVPNVDRQGKSPLDYPAKTAKYRIADTGLKAVSDKGAVQRPRIRESAGAYLQLGSVVSAPLSFNPKCRGIPMSLPLLLKPKGDFTRCFDCYWQKVSAGKTGGIVQTCLIYGRETKDCEPDCLFYKPGRYGCNDEHLYEGGNHA